MKKLFLALAVVAFMASFSSCTKMCTCTTYLAGQATGSPQEIELDSHYKNCADMSTVIDMGIGKTGMECE